MRLLVVALLSLAWAAPYAHVEGARIAAEAPEPAARNGTAEVVVELDEPAATTIFAAERPKGEQHARGAAQQHVHQIDRSQQRLLPAINSLGGKVLYRLQRVYDGIAVSLPAAKIDALRTLPGVRAVHAAVRHRPTNADTIPLIGGPKAWSYAGGGTGRGVKIGIIDTGIDYTHLDFAGAGTVAAFTAARANPGILSPDGGFPSAKVAGGIDLVGDNYDADGATGSPVPMPDPNPIDCYSSFGHGTHVAATAAGIGITSDGALYRGPYSTATDFGSFRVGPGVAPEATLFAVKVFGCSGSTAMTPAAIEWAIDPNGDGDFGDRLDVINLSLGSEFGSDYDASAVAADNAAAAGIVVVASAGNSGDTYYVTGSPATARRAISVAASSGDTVASFSARGPRRGDNGLKPDIAAPGENIFSADRGSGNGGRYLSGTSMASPHVAGSAALLREAHPDWTVEEIKAALLNTSGTQLHDVAGRRFSPLREGAGRLDVGRAINTTAAVFSADDPGSVSVSFGAPEVVDSLTMVRNLRLVNKDPAHVPLTYTVGISPTLAPIGTTVLALRRSVTVAPGGSTTIPIELAIPDAAGLSRMRDPTMVALADGMVRHFLNEVAGVITLVPDDPARGLLEISYFGAPRRAGMRRTTASNVQLQRPGGTAVLAMQGSTPSDPALVSVYELQHSSPPKLPSPTEAGVAATPGAAADLQYVGIASDFGHTGDVAASSIMFGLSTYADWSTPNEVSIDIDVDSNRDGIYDYEIATTDSGPGGSLGGLGDSFVVRVTPLSGSSPSAAGHLNFVDGSVDTALFNGRVVGFSVGAAQLGLSGANPRFNYRVRTYDIDVYDSRFTPELVDQSPVLSYDVAHPGITAITEPPVLEGSPLYSDDANAALHVAYNTAGFGSNRSQGILLLHHNNLSNQQAQAITAEVAPPILDHHLYLSLIVNNGP